ncbi:WG repeat-containing protein [Bacillus sp. DJP31]|uniref:WG repeat-containing protein n=1 Tax=Bacillus sp. DJP31 TaxID=3409789 RepID=UPI003BB7AA59
MYAKKMRLYPASVKTVKGSVWGYINKEGECAVRPTFDYTMDFQANGLSIVEKNNQYGLINEFGKFVVQPTYQSINDFSERRAIVSTDEGYFVMDEKGKLLTTEPYQYIGMYQESRAQFSILKDNSYFYGFLDLNGKEAIPTQYKSAYDFQNMQAIVQLENSFYALINQDGKVLQTYSYPYIADQGDGLVAFKKADDFEAKFGVMDLGGNVILSPTYSGIQPFQDGRAVVNIAEDFKNNFGLIDRKGTYIIKPIYNDITMLGQERVSVGKALDEEKPYLGSRFAIATTDGMFLTDFKYDQVQHFDQGFASANNDIQTFFINKKGKIASELPVLRGTGSLTLEGDMIKAFIDQRVSYMTRDGKIIWMQNTVIPLNRMYKVIEKKYMPNKEYLVYYPQVTGMKNEKTEKSVNEKLKELSQVKEIDATKPVEYSYTGDYDVEFFNEELLVLEINGYEFPFGAAHGMPLKVYPHTNLRNGTFYKLKDFFKPGSEYVKVLSDIIGEQIKNDETYSYVFPDTYKWISPDQPFYISEDVLFIYFTPYDIAPYAAGFPTFTIFYSEILDIINKEGDFWKSFHQRKEGGFQGPPV